MMKDTPRTFVGPVVFLLREPLSPESAAAVCAEVEEVPGISSCTIDTTAGAVVVTARQPVDRTTVVATLDRLGCRFRG